MLPLRMETDSLLRWAFRVRIGCCDADDGGELGHAVVWDGARGLLARAGDRLVWREARIHFSCISARGRLPEEARLAELL